MAVETNWRGLPVHAVDQWDHWNLNLNEYMQMRDTWDQVRDLLESQLADMSLVMSLMECADRARRMEQADDDAGEDI